MDKINNISIFAKCYNKQANDTLKKQYLDANIKLVNEYIPISQKLVAVEALVKSTMKDMETGQYKDNTNLRYIMYNLKLFSLYLNVEINFDNSNDIFNTYDLLKQHGLFDVFYNIIPESERKEFLLFLRAEEVSYEKMYNSLPNYFNKKISEFSIGMESLNALVENIMKEQEAK